MTQFNPKELFQKVEHRRVAWAELASDPRLHEAMAYTQAQLVTKGLGPDYLAGVNGFIAELLNLSEAEIPLKPMPTRHLKSFDNLPPTTTTPPK